MSETPSCVPERVASPETRIPLATAAPSNTIHGTTHSENLDARYDSPHPEATTLFGKDEHQQSQSNDESLSTQNPHDGTPHGENFVVPFLLTIKGILRFRIVNVLLVFVPMGITIHMAHMPNGLILAMNVMATLPLGRLLNFTHERAAARLGNTAGASMNIAFGYAVELIILLISLSTKDILRVQVSAIQWLLVNVFLVLGMCFPPGGLQFGVQMYNRRVTLTNAYLVGLSVVANFLLPAASQALFASEATADHRASQASRGANVVLLTVYFIHLILPFFDALNTLDKIHLNAASRSTTRKSHSSSSESCGSDPDGLRSVVGAARRFRPEEDRGDKVGGSAGSDKDTNVGLKKGATASTTSDSTDTNLVTSPSSYIRLDDIGDMANYKRQPEIKRSSQNLQERARMVGKDLAASQTKNTPQQYPRQGKKATLFIFVWTTVIAVCASLLLSWVDGWAGNAAAALNAALSNKMGVAISAVVSSSVHIAFVAPLFATMKGMVVNEMAEYLTVFESACVVIAACLARLLWLDGRAAEMTFWYWMCVITD